MAYTVSGLITGMTGDVVSGLVPGLKGYGISNRLPTEGKKDSDKLRDKSGHTKPVSTRCLSRLSVIQVMIIQGGLNQGTLELVVDT